jgi:hypothetical protein
MDFEFRGKAQTGLDVIEELGIADRSILVTAHSDEDVVMARARFLGVKVLPKAVMELVPIIETDMPLGLTRAVLPVLEETQQEI